MLWAAATELVGGKMEQFEGCAVGGGDGAGGGEIEQFEAALWAAAGRRRRSWK